MVRNMRVSEELKAHYDSYYDGGSEWRWLGALDKASNIVSLCSRYPHRTILEIGAGEGSILKRLSDVKFGDALYALEISQSAMDAIRRRNIESIAECRLFDGYNIPYEDHKFDLAILSHVVEHLEYPRKMLYEAGRVANFVFIEVPCEDNLRLKRDFVSDPVGHINFYSPKTIRRLAQTCNLEVLLQVVTHPSYSVYRYQLGRKAWLRYLPKELMLRFMPGLATCLWTYHSVLVCSKKPTSPI